MFAACCNLFTVNLSTINCLLAPWQIRWWIIVHTAILGFAYIYLSKLKDLLTCFAALKNGSNMAQECNVRHPKNDYGLQTPWRGTAK